MPEKLPKGWVKTTLGEINVPSRNRAQPREAPDLPYVGMEHVEAQTMKLLGQGEVSGLKSSSVRFAQGDVLYGKMRPYLNKVWLAEFDGLCSPEFLVFPKTEGLNSQLFAYQLNAQNFVNFANQQVSGDRPRVDFEKLATFPYLLPPSREQERIVAKLDALLSRIAAGEAAARRAQERLKRYRVAVLHAAVTGELTRDWRKTHKPTETGAQLLKRLLHERRARWEEAELKRLHAAGKPPKDDMLKARYHEPALPKTNGLPVLPVGWTWASLGQLLGLLKNGIGIPPNEESGLPTLRISAVRPMFVNLNERRYFPKSLTKKFGEFALNEGDLLFTRYNGSKDLAGVCGRVPALNETLVHPDKLIRCVVVPGFAPLDRYVEIAANCGVSRKTISDSLRTTAGQWGLSGAVLKEIPIPLPPINEQKAIVSEVEHRFAAAERLTTTLNCQLDRAHATRQSLLSEAFTGSLVPQDQREEPGSILLEHIRAAREAEAQIPKIKMQTRKPNTKRPPVKPKLPIRDEGNQPSRGFAQIAPQPAPTSPRQVRLLRLKLHHDFNSLKASEFALRKIGKSRERLSPICLVGLNGSGKSNLIEVLSEIFCHVELSLLPWKSITKDQRASELCFDLEYQLLSSTAAKPTTVRLEKPNRQPVVFKVVHNDREEIVSGAEQCLALLPTRVLGYSSGLNETISISYFRTAAIYSQEVLAQARREKDEPNANLSDVPDSRTFFMDYEFNALILVANYLLQPRPRLELFRENVRIDSLNAFDIRYRSNYQGNKQVELTRELQGYLDAIRSCANSVDSASDKNTEVFHFTDPKSAAPKLKAVFKTAGNFFRALYKLSLLNPLALSGKKRKFFLREDSRTGQLERPPTISREERIFSVDNIRVNLTEPKCAIDYAGVSDGEHQFLQIYGSVILFDEPGCVFLLDEPETHFNPKWRRLGIQWLAKFKSTKGQELMISTHSPFVVSGCKGKNVFKFTREGDQCMCLPVGFETFGASYDFLLARIFGMDTMVAGEAIEEMRELVRSTSIERLRNAIPEFGESLEKRFIFERIAQLEAKKKGKKT